MSNVTRKEGCFQAARALRTYAQQNGVMGKLLPACRAANKELADGRTVAVAVTQGLKVMRS